MHLILKKKVPAKKEEPEKKVLYQNTIYCQYPKQLHY